MGSRTPSSVPGVFLWKLRWNSWENDRDNSRTVPCQEMVACLRGSELAHRWKHAKGIACEHDDVARLAVDDARDFGVRDVVNRIGTASVLGDANIIVVWHTRKRVVDDILEDTSEANGVEYLGLLFTGEVDTFGIAPALDVEHASVRPDMLVVTDEEATGVCGKGGLACAGEAKEKSDITILHAYVSRGVQRELTKFDRLEVMLRNDIGQTRDL